MLEYIDMCNQEINLKRDIPYFDGSSSTAAKAILVCDLIRAIRLKWTDPEETVISVAKSREMHWIHMMGHRTVMNYYYDWRCHNCTGFTASQKGHNHTFTILIDAHPDLEATCRDWLIPTYQACVPHVCLSSSKRAHGQTIFTSCKMSEFYVCSTVTFQL